MYKGGYLILDFNGIEVPYDEQVTITGEKAIKLVDKFCNELLGYGIKEYVSKYNDGLIVEETLANSLTTKPVLVTNVKVGTWEKLNGYVFALYDLSAGFRVHLHTYLGEVGRSASSNILTHSDLIIEISWGEDNPVEDCVCILQRKDNSI